MNWLKFKWGNLKRRWRLAIHGENIILNAIDAMHAAGFQMEDSGVSGPPDLLMARMYHGMAMAHLKLAIDYHDEPEPIYPDDAMELADGAIPPIPAGYARHAPIYIEDDGIEHVVPKDFRQQEIA